jgi:hypothetical protein
MNSRVLLDDQFFTIAYEEETKFLLFTRKSAPLPLGREGLAMMERVERALLPFDPASTAILFDMREAPFQSNESYHQGVTQARQRVESRFKITCVLVKTAVGKLQVSRVAREEGRPPAAFLDEAEARAYLRAAMQRSR